MLYFKIEVRREEYSKNNLGVNHGYIQSEVRKLEQEIMSHMDLL